MNGPIPGPGHPQMQPPSLPEDVQSLYGSDTDPDPRPPEEQIKLLQNELDGIASGIVQLEDQERMLKSRLAAARALCRAVDAEILRLQNVVADAEAAGGPV